MLTTHANEATDLASDAGRRSAPEADSSQPEVAPLGAIDAYARTVGARATPPPPALPPPPPNMSAVGHALASGHGSRALDWLQPDGFTYLQRSAGNRAVAGLVARRNHTGLSTISRTGSAPTVARAVTKTKVVRHKLPVLIGDGTAANPGMSVSEFEAYISRQADWSIEPSVSGADRTRLWAVANLLGEGSHFGTALGELRLRELATASAADLVSIRGYAEGAKGTPANVRITRPDASIARVKELGAAMRDLATFVPAPVLRICFNQTGLESLVDEKLIGELKTYYRDFTPTIENPKEQAPLLVLLRGTIAPFAALKDWVHDLHHLTPDTRLQLVTNVADKSRARPVMLVLMSGLDWNGAFLQKANLESAVKNPKNLALLVQGAKSLADETAKVNKIADDYGQKPVGAAKARLGQVVIAGHGQSTTVEQTTTGAGATGVKDKRVDYGSADLHPTAPGDDSEKLIDAVLSRMDPKDANLVFAGCLVGSHDIPESPDLKNRAKAAKAINDLLKKDPNLRDLVQIRMKALKVKGKVEAANASTTFSAFNLDADGKARLSLVWDPDVGGSKKKYVRTGAEPEGALRAALETWADPSLGPKWTTTQMRKHVADQAATKEWWQSITRTAFKIALPAAGDVDPSVLANLAHRVESWLLAGWNDSASVDRLVHHVKAAEGPVLYPVMLASDRNDPSFPHLPIVVQEAWMHIDATHEAAFMAAIGATPLKRTELAKHLSAGVVDPHLATMLKTVDPLKPTRAQLYLALLIAVERGSGMPAPVQTLLRDAAGGKKTTAFPAALNVVDLLDGTGELVVLRAIGLAPGAPAAKGAPATPDEANVDVDFDKTNETFVAVAPRIVKIGASPKTIYAKPDKTSAITGVLLGGALMIGGVMTAQKSLQIVGTAGGFTVVDLDAKLGFVDGALP